MKSVKCIEVNVMHIQEPCWESGETIVTVAGALWWALPDLILFSGQNKNKSQNRW